MQRRGGDGLYGRLEEGKAENQGDEGSAPRRVHSEEDVRRKKDQVRQGWNPTIVLLVAAIIMSLCLAGYQYEQASNVKGALVKLSGSLNTNKDEQEKIVAASKRRIEELESVNVKATQVEKDLLLQVQTLHSELTVLRHDLHEERVKSARMHRDNLDLHKRVKVKVAELKILEEQTHAFEKEMSQLTKTIHGLQKGDKKESEGTDYATLYKKQEEQQNRMKSGSHHHSIRDGEATSVHHKPGVERSKEELLAEEMAGEETDGEDVLDDA